MAKFEAGFPARYYIHLCKALEQQGVDVPALLAAVNLPADFEQQSVAILKIAQVEKLIDEATRISGRRDLAHDLGKTLKLSSHGVIGFAFLSSPTLDYALRLAAQYFSLIMPPFSVRYRPGPDLALVDIQPNKRMSPSCLLFHLELLATAFHWEIRDLLQNQLPAYDLYLAFPAPAHKNRFRELTEARCHFEWQEQPGIRLALPPAVVGQSLKLADPLALQEAEARCKAVVRYAVDRSEVSEWVEMLLLESTDKVPRLQDVARSLNTSARTLGRHLRKEGLTYRQLVNKAQHQKACQLLSNTNKAVTEIAFELGFTDASNFARAFRRETGMSPQQWRAR